MKKPFFARHGLLLLMVVFFLAPFGLRGARLAVQRMKNDVKDWLPADFAETRELDWFREHFLGEQFVVVSWEGCTGRINDPMFMDLVDGFFPEVPPSERQRRMQLALQAVAPDVTAGADFAAAVDGATATGATATGATATGATGAGPELNGAKVNGEATSELTSLPADDEAEDLLAADTLSRNWPLVVDRSEYIDRNLGMYVRQLHVGDLPPADEFIGNQLGLFYVHNDFFNWGGQQEKWIQGRKDQWYYITPSGSLYRWQGGSSIVQPIMNTARRLIRGPTVNGDLVAELGEVDGRWFYEDPNRLSARLFKTVTTGPGVLHQLTAAGAVLEGDTKRGLERLAGTLFGNVIESGGTQSRGTRGPLATERSLAVDDPDAARQTCIVITLTEAAKMDLRLATGRGILGKPVGKLLQLATAAGIHPPPHPSLVPPFLAWMLPAPAPEPIPQLKLGGPSVDNVAIDEEGQITLVRLVGLSLFVGIGLSWISLRSVNLTIMVFLVGGLSAVASLSFVYWGGSSVDAVLMSMPSLVYVLGLSGAVHIINYYREAIEEHGLRRAPGQALKVGWKPCTLAAITTALGLLSLNTSHIAPIKKFGIFAALGVVATLLLLFTYLPAALQTWPPRRFRRREGEAIQPFGLETMIANFWHGMGQFVLKHYVGVLVTCTVVMVGVGLGLSRIRTDVQLLRMFDKDAKIIRDYRWLEGNLGKLVPMELIVDVNENALRDTTQDGSTSNAVSLTEDVAAELSQLTFLERMEIVHNIQEALDTRFGNKGSQVIGNPMSAITFAVEMPRTGGGLARIAERGGISRRLESHREEFLASDYLRLDQQSQSELWRISLRLGALSDIDYGEFVGELKETIEPIVAAYSYRRQILEALAQERGIDNVRSSSVYLVGVPFGRSKSAPKLTVAFAAELKAKQQAAKQQAAKQQAAKQQAAQSATASDGDGDGEGEGEAVAETSVTQTAIFAKVFGRLLSNAGLELRDWYDPRCQAPEAWDATLSQYDCVVLVDNEVAIDPKLLATSAALFVDARDHVYHLDQGTLREQGQTWQTSYTALVDGQSVARPQNLNRDVSVVYTGLVPVVYKAQRTLLESLIVSTAWAFGMIAIVMILVVRSVRAGLLSMIPNVFPVLLVFGAMGWAGILVDIGSMMTASVAMGVAVDDTIHFLTWFRRGLDEGKSRQNSILQAYARVGTAMTQTTAIGGLGLSIFAFSTFTPTQRFGTLMLALLAAALIGDLIFLPALLASPLGRVFDGKGRKRKPGQDLSVTGSATGPAAPNTEPSAKDSHGPQIGPHRRPYVKSS